jgi:threonine dehydrogenase-like Zn-dependent dehydrogenase
MKAALFYGGKDIRIEEVPDPVPGPGQALIQIKSAGICGSDLHGYREVIEDPWFGRPAMDGHELAGIVAELGPGVKNLRVGDEVGVEPRHLIGCGECRYCREGHYEACRNRGMVDGKLGHSNGFAELDVAPEANCHLLPEGVGIEAASITDVYACAVHALHIVPPKPRHTVVIMGSGPIGIACAEAYRAAGAKKVILSGRRKALLDRIKKWAADEVIDVSQVDLVDAVMDLTNGEGADIVIEAVGGDYPGVDTALHVVAPSGTVGVLGISLRPQPIDLMNALFRQAKIMWINSYARWDGVPEFQITLDMMADGRFHPLEMITHHFPLDKIGEGFAAAANKAESGAIKVLINP